MRPFVIPLGALAGGLDRATGQRYERAGSGLYVQDVGGSVQITLHRKGGVSDTVHAARGTLVTTPFEAFTVTHTRNAPGWLAGLVFEDGESPVALPMPAVCDLPAQTATLERVVGTAGWFAYAQLYSISTPSANLPVFGVAYVRRIDVRTVRAAAASGRVAWQTTTSAAAMGSLGLQPGSFAGGYAYTGFHDLTGQPGIFLPVEVGHGEVDFTGSLGSAPAATAGFAVTGHVTRDGEWTNLLAPNDPPVIVPPGAALSIYSRHSDGELHVRLTYHVRPVSPATLLPLT